NPHHPFPPQARGASSARMVSAAPPPPLAPARYGPITAWPLAVTRTERGARARRRSLERGAGRWYPWQRYDIISRRLPTSVAPARGRANGARDPSPRLPRDRRSDSRGHLRPPPPARRPPAARAGASRAVRRQPYGRARGAARAGAAGARRGAPRLRGRRVRGRAEWHGAARRAGGLAAPGPGRRRRAVPGARAGR